MTHKLFHTCSPPYEGQTVWILLFIVEDELSHEGEISILAGRKYETESLGSARQAALALVADAQARANAMTAQARGDAGAFLNLQAAYSSAPSAFEHRLRLLALSDALEGRALNIIDYRIEQDGGVLWFQD